MQRRKFSREFAEQPLDPRLRQNRAQQLRGMSPSNSRSRFLEKVE
jgi:hypothetical protein